jgi:hypothetical protein
VSAIIKWPKGLTLNEYVAMYLLQYDHFECNKGWRPNEQALCRLIYRKAVPGYRWGHAGKYSDELDRFIRTRLGARLAQR